MKRDHVYWRRPPKRPPKGPPKGSITPLKRRPPTTLLVFSQKNKTSPGISDIYISMYQISIFSSKNNVIHVI